jgi:hypothetical protein
MNEQERGTSQDARYTALTLIWTHQNTTQFQWPSIILGAIFVALSLLIDKVTAAKLVDTAQWGVDPQVKWGAGVLMVLIGLGTTVMLYTMARSRRVRKRVEGELADMDSKFAEINHPRGPSGAKLIWWFMALVALAVLIMGACFLSGLKLYLAVGLAVTVIPWLAVAWYGVR